MKIIFLELIRFRSLVVALTQRHVSTRYRGSAFGFFWSLLNPLCLMAIYTLVFKFYMRFDGGSNYHILVFAGLLPWLWSSSALGEGTASIVSSGHLITKSIFPAHILPLVSIASTLINFLLALPILALFVVVADLSIPATWLFLPVLVIAHALFLYGLLLGLSALNVFYRDVQHIVGNLLTFIFFLCPVVYPVSTVPERFRPMLKLNPFALLTVMYQDTLVHGTIPELTDLVYLFTVAALACLVGAAIHQHHRESFAEAL